MIRDICLMAMSIFLFLSGYAVSQAATSSLDNLPGGAGISYFHASASGDTTLLNIQNIDSAPILVHVIIWDENSSHIINFNIPLSGWDNWGCAISGDGSAITVNPQTPCYFDGANNGCFSPLTRSMPMDSDGFQRGYITFVVTAGDSAYYGGDGNGDPRNDPALTLASIGFYDVLMGRTAILNPVAGAAISLNSTMLQGFVNIYSAPGLNELSDAWDTVNDALVPMFYNCDADVNDVFPSNGNIDSWEILLTDWNSREVVADDTDGDGIGETLYNAVGSASKVYVGRFNENPSFPSETVLITLFPANSGESNSPACGFSSRTMSVFCYDDNEMSISSSVTPEEVASNAFGSGGIAVPGYSGECQIFVDAPLIGFTYMEAGNYAGLYPLVKADQFVNAADGFVSKTSPAFGHPTAPGFSEVIEIGTQESY